MALAALWAVQRVLRRSCCLTCGAQQEQSTGRGVGLACLRLGERTTISGVRSWGWPGRVIYRKVGVKEALTMSRSSEATDVVSRAFPGALGDLVHQAMGRAVVRLVDAGLELDAARALVHAAADAIIEEYEV